MQGLVKFLLHTFIHRKYFSPSKFIGATNLLHNALTNSWLFVHNNIRAEVNTVTSLQPLRVQLTLLQQEIGYNVDYMKKVPCESIFYYHVRSTWNLAVWHLRYASGVSTFSVVFTLYSPRHRTKASAQTPLIYYTKMVLLSVMYYVRKNTFSEILLI